MKFSRVGFGSSKACTEEHGRALARALDGGLNVVDTAINYGAGESERLVGQVLEESGRREQVFLISKLGYVRGTLLQQLRESPPPGLLNLGRELGYCVSPEFLAAEFPRSLERLRTERLDACLLHNPEEVLEAAVRRGESSVPALREGLRASLQAAFAFLEEQVARGTLGGYGVSSNRFATSPLERGAVPLALVVEAGGPNLKAIELPLNLLEPQAALRPVDGSRTVLEQALERKLQVFANRPMSGTNRSGGFRLKSVPEQDGAPDLESLLLELKGLEKQWRRGFRNADTPRGPEFCEGLRGIAGRLGNGWGHQARIQAQQDSAERLLERLGEQVSPELLAGWEDWRSRYRAALKRNCEVIAAQARTRSHGFARRLEQRIDPLLPGPLRSEDLCRKALHVVASTPGVSCVLNGMHRPEYVDDALAALDWKPLQNPLEVYRALS